MNPKKNFLISFIIFFISFSFIDSLFAVDVDIPDYTIISVSPNRYTQVQGGIIVLTTVVKNVGDGATLRSSSLVWEYCTGICGKEENWSVGETDTISGLKVGQEEIETYSHEMPFGTTYFRVQCDYVDGNSAGVIVEKDESNNLFELPVIQIEYPDLQIASYDNNGTEPIWLTPRYPIEGQEVTFHAGITNRGKGGTIEDFEVEFIIYIDQKENESVSLGNQKYQEGIPLGPMLQNKTFCYVSSKDTWPAVAGFHSVKAKVNPGGDIEEKNEIYDNLSDPIDISIQKPDIKVSNVWWVPEVPTDGEEVTFYSSIENSALGGSILEFDVEFILQELDFELDPVKDTSLGTATVTDQILPAQKEIIESFNYDADDINREDWNVISGSVSIESYCDDTDSMCLNKLGNSKYVRLSGANTIIRSKNSYNIYENEILVFRANASGSGNRWFSLCKPGTDCSGTNQLLTQEISTSKDSWQVYVMDVSALIGESFTCEIKTGKSSNIILKVDDIGKAPVSQDGSILQPVMFSIPLSDVWEAFPFSDKISFTPGRFNIIAKLSDENFLTESLHDETALDKPWIDPADYDFISISVSPPSQFIGKNFLYEVLIKNYGGPTIIDSNMNWYLSTREGQYGKSLETDEIPGLARNETFTHTFELPVVNGNVNVYAFINDDLLLKETNSWSEDNTQYNRAFDMRFVNDVDLEVKKIWWRVEEPLEGQDPYEPMEGQEVRFYARIDNIGLGGAVTDFDVQFIIDETKYEEIDLKTTTVKDDILFGKLGESQSNFTNAGFEGNCANSSDDQNRLCGWDIIAGSVSSESYCGIDDTLCICSRSNDSAIDVDAACNPDELNGNLYYARLSGGGTKFRSVTFDVTKNIIEFKAQVTGSGTKKLRLCDENDNCLEQTYTDKSFWNAYMLDVSSFIGRRVYIELSIEGSGNMEFWVDDFRMNDSFDSNVFVTTVESKDTWAATTGSHEIRVKADVKNVLSEPDDYDPNNPTANTNNVKHTIIPTIKETDYWIKQPADFQVLQNQIQGREIQVMAEIKNIGSGTSLETDLYWYTCLDTENPSCADQDNWRTTWGNPAQKLKVPALSEGQSYTSIFTYTAEYGKTYIIAEVNPESNVSEAYINNNIVYYNPEPVVNKPKLAVQSIWWLPEKPKDGEEVTFYAAIVNGLDIDSGGTIEDFEVSFIVRNQEDNNQSEDLGSTKIKDDILLADRRIIYAFDEADCVFATKEKESNKWAPWQKLTGSASIVDRCNQLGETCKNEITNRYYAKLEGENAKIRSNPFILEDDLILFSGYTDGSGTKTIQIKQMLVAGQYDPDDPILFNEQYTEKQTWRANLIKIESGHTNERVYIEAMTQGASNAVFVIDDFRMTFPSTDDVFVTIAASSKVWTASPGSFDVSVAVSVDGAGGSGLNKELTGEDTVDNTLVKKADYFVTGLTFSPDKQIQGNDVQATATITNIGGATLVESEIQWEVGGKTTKESLKGLAADEVYTTTFTFTPEYEQNDVKVSADATNVIIEENENNNIDLNQIYIDKPKLEIGSIWWSPENPKDGQEVTFFARIDNIEKGGTSDDIEVRFLVSKGVSGTQVELSKEKLTADIPFALGTSAFPNADFSGEDSFFCNGANACDAIDTFKNWKLDGQVFAESRCTIDDLQCPDKIIELVNTPNMNCGFESYARLKGYTTLRSQVPFNKVAFKYIMFKAYASGSGSSRVEVLDSTDTPIIKWPITDKSWTAHIIPVASYNLDFNEDYYFQAVTEGADNASLMIDDIRIVSTTENSCRTMVAKVQSSKTWIAQPNSSGDYYIHVEATDNTGTTPKPTLSVPIGSVSMANYEIKEIKYTPQEQTKGKTVKFDAILENSGSDTLVESELSWFTCHANCEDGANWKKIWKEQQTETISALAKNDQYTSTYVLTTEFADNHVLVFCDSGNVIVEEVEEIDVPVDKVLYEFDNIKKEKITIEKPDLRISKIGYYPKSPVDGEEVTFYAQIENIEKGGTIDEIETTFLITDANGVETTIEAEKSSNEVMFAFRLPIFQNADFELGSLANWTKQGTVYIVKDDLDYQKIEPNTTVNDPIDEKYYVKVYGDGTKLWSTDFIIEDSQSISFKGQTAGSGTKQIFIRKCSSNECLPKSTDTILKFQDFTESSPWRTCILDVSGLLNEHVYLEIKTSGSDNSEFWVDDFRMKTGSDFTYVETVQSKNTWIALPGNHTLKAIVDSKQAITEYDETNNELTGMFNLINAVDYSITSLTYTPEEQIQGKEIVFTAIIENQTSNSTLIESELEWYVCQGPKKTCDYEKNWVSKSKEKVPGLTAEGTSTGKYTSTFNLEVTYDDSAPKEDDKYLLQVKIICDSGNVLAEDKWPDAENNNEAIRHIEVYHPDLSVGDIWWFPENPVYGEDVTFYARIENIERGGTIQDFEVNFVIDNWNSAHKTELGSTKMTTETPFAKRKPLGNNSSFESGLESWEKISGNVSWESKCPETDSECPGGDATTRYGDLHYASVYGANSIFQSEPFQRTGNSLVFRGMTEGSGTKKLIIKDRSGNNRIERSYTDKSPWRSYVIDIQKDDHGKVIEPNLDLYVQIQTSGADNAKFMVDDFRSIADNTSKSIIGYVESKSTWSATPDIPGDVHSISVIVDEKNDVKEVNEKEDDDHLKEGLNIKTEQLKSIGHPDYVVSITDYSPRKQIQGRNIELTAVIENQLSSTLLDSELQWSTCQDSEIACMAQGAESDKYWKKQQTDKITGGIAEGQKYTVVYSMQVPAYLGTKPEDNPDGYTIYVRAKADVNDVIDEKGDAEDELNEAIKQIEIDHPDLIITDAWCIPEKPIDGQEVTFYALIQNQGSGGTLEDYEVSFYVDKGLTTEEELGTAKMQDDIPFGNRLPLTDISGRSIGDFETTTILSKSNTSPHTDWTRMSGEVYISNHFQETELPYDTKRVKNKKYLYVSGSGAIAQSSPFKLKGDALIFRAQTNGSGNKTLSIRPVDTKANLDDPLIENNYDDKSPWRAYLLDIEKWENIDAYLEIKTSGGLIQLDDFRMIKTPTTEGTINVGTAVSPKIWLARNSADGQGVTITVVADSGGKIHEETRTFVVKKRLAGNRYVGSLSKNDVREGEVNNKFEKRIFLATYTEDLGDIDGNGKRDLSDLIRAAQIVADFNKSLKNRILIDNVDVDADNQIGLAEMIYLMVYIAENQDSHQYK